MPDLKRCWKSHQFKTREPFAFPELWDCWIDLDTRKPLYSFTIITTHATALDAHYATIAALVMSCSRRKLSDGQRNFWSGGQRIQSPRVGVVQYRKFGTDMLHALGRNYFGTACNF